MASPSSIASYTPEPQQQPTPETRPAIVPRRSKCSESFHVHYSSLTVLRDIQTMTSGGKNTFYGGIRGIAERTGLNKDTVRLAMNRLMVEGWLVTEVKWEWRNGQGRTFAVLTHDQFVEKRGRDSCR